jgi:hypothetical protein
MRFLNLHGFLFFLLFQRKLIYIVFEIVILVISISYSNLSMIFEFVFKSNCYSSVSYWYLKQGLINLFFVFLNASWYGVLVLYLMLFQITSIQVLFFTSLNLTHKLFPLFFFLNMHLWMLLQICCCCEFFAAFLTNKRFLIFMNLLMSIQIRFLVKTLRAALIITRIWFFSCVYYFVPW